MCLVSSPVIAPQLPPTSNMVQLQPLNTDPDTAHLLLVGGGPRSIIQANSEIVFMLMYREHFDDLIQRGATYQMSTTIVEQQQIMGVGASFSSGQTGMMNSGIEDDIVFPLPSSSSQLEDHEVLKSLLSYKKRYERYTGRDVEGYYQHLKELNLPGAVMFKRSMGPMSNTADGQMDHERAYLMRKTVGEEEYETFAVIGKLAKAFLPFYNLRVMDSTSVRRIFVQNVGKQLVSVEKVGDGTKQYINADQVRMNTGTTTRNPIEDPAVQKLTFCQRMNVNAFKAYCSSRQLLDNDGLLRPGVKVLTGGMGLSGLDQLSVLDGVMNIFEEDDSNLLGYRVREEAKRKYQGAISMISRTPGKVCVPRHTFTAEWMQDTPVIANSKHLHSLFLHSHGEEVFKVWTDILKASVARATNRTPDETTCPDWSTEDLLRLQFEETTSFLDSRREAGLAEKRGDLEAKEYFLKESTKTLYGAWRQAALCLIFGFGLEENLDKATETMESYAPHTWKGRQVWLFHRTQIASLTDPRFATKKSNMEYFKNWDALMRHVTSSPVEIHSMFHLLLDSGIATYETASYSDIHSSPNEDKIEMNGSNYDALLVSPVFERNEEEVIQSLDGQLQPFDATHPGYGKVGKFRRFIDSAGKSVPVEDHGLGGRGFDSTSEEGSQTRVGSFAIDLNNRASGVSVASSLTLRRMALAHLKAAGVSSAEAVLDDIYEESKPAVEAYDAEVQKFESHFEEAFEIWAYLEAIKFISEGDSELFKVLYDNGLTKTSRKEQIRKMHASGEEIVKEAASMYDAKVSQVPSFNPPSRNDYLDRFVDTTDEEDAFMYTKALNLAKKHLEESRE